MALIKDEPTNLQLLKLTFTKEESSKLQLDKLTFSKDVFTNENLFKLLPSNEELTNLQFLNSIVLILLITIWIEENSKLTISSLTQTT